MGWTCVVADILRATSAQVVALAHGARGIVPCSGPAEALQRRQAAGAGWVCGEVGGVPPEGFDLGNSPCAFACKEIEGRQLYHSTTNGTRAVLACTHASQILIGSFLNLGATAAWFEKHGQDRLCLVCAGTGDTFALEDALFAGAFCERIGVEHPARSIWRGRDFPLEKALAASQNGRHLTRIRLSHDISYCARTDLFSTVGRWENGEIVQVGDHHGDCRSRRSRGELCR